NDEGTFQLSLSFGFRHSFGLRHSSFVIYKVVARLLTPETVHDSLVTNATPAAERFASEKSTGLRRIAARRDPANARHRHGRWRWHTFVPVNEGPRQTGCAARRQISHRRYPDQQLSELRAALDLCTDPVQHHVAASAYSSQLQIRQFLAQLCGHSRRSTNARRFAVVSGNC